jgi:hypothetical protein
VGAAERVERSGLPGRFDAAASRVLGRVELAAAQQRAKRHEPIRALNVVPSGSRASRQPQLQRLDHLVDRQPAAQAAVAEAGQQRALGHGRPGQVRSEPLDPLVGLAYRRAVGPGHQCQDQVGLERRRGIRSDRGRRLDLGAEKAAQLIDLADREVRGGQ